MDYCDMSYDETMIEKCGEGCYFTYIEKSNGLGGYRAVNIEFHNPTEGINRKITDKGGKFINFPGYAEGDWMKYAKYSLDMPTIRFNHMTGTFKDGKLPFYWIFQPDGRYYADDDGFGMENDDEITLISVMNMEGEFVQPFELYK